jgi:hypothetical protein
LRLLSGNLFLFYIFVVMRNYSWLFILLANYCQAQVLGCTDVKSKNYNPKATQNDGSCVYKNEKIQLTSLSLLNEKLVETSGLIHWNNKFWTHNDDTDTHLYALDTLDGHILETYDLPNVTNTDWEEISQDDNYLYIGDFGNNAHGNRTDLHILRVEKNSLLNRNPQIDYIKFTYPNQIDFFIKKANRTDFDCEAFVVTQDSIFLFTKEWNSKKTTIYALPKMPGDYTAQKKESYDVEGLITAANYIASKNKLVLSGYTKGGQPFLYLFYDFVGTDFFSANKRKLKIKPKFQQIEGISSTDGIHYYISSEHLQFLTIDDLQKLQMIDLSSFF